MPDCSSNEAVLSTALPSISAGECLVHKQMPTNTRDPVTNAAAMPNSFYRTAPVTWKGYPGEKCVVDKVSNGGWAHRERRFIWEQACVGTSPVSPLLVARTSSCCEFCVGTSVCNPAAPWLALRSEGCWTITVAAPVLEAPCPLLTPPRPAW